MKLSRYFTDRAARYTMLICAASSFVILLAIAVFIIAKGLPTFKEVNPFKFLFGTVWRPSSGQYGILAMIIGSIAVTIGALLIAIPLGIACAVLLAEVAPLRVRQLLRPAVELLVGIPSVVYGLVGLVILVPAISHIGGSGFSILAASIVLAVMVMPTIISISEDSIRAVPRGLQRGSLSTGCNTLADYLARSLAVSQIRNCCQYRAGNGSCYRRNNGNDYGYRKCDKNSHQHS